MASTVGNARAARIPDLDQDYNVFLYATIGVDAKGSAVSVLSAMARLNLDPWVESKALANMPASAAARRLVSLIAAAPGVSANFADHGRRVDQLIKLLPRRARVIFPVMAPRKLLPGVEFLTQSRTALYALFALIALLLVINWLGTSRTSPSPQHATPVSATAQPVGNSANADVAE